MRIFYERLKKLRLQSDFTQQEVADKLNISRTAVGKYELGIAYPDVEKLKILSHIYNCSVDYLLGLSDHVKIISPNELKRFHEMTEIEKIIGSKNISEKEAKLIEKYRQLDERGKAAVESALNFEYEQSAREADTKKATG